MTQEVQSTRLRSLGSEAFFGATVVVAAAWSGARAFQLYGGWGVVLAVAAVIVAGLGFGIRRRVEERWSRPILERLRAEHPDGGVTAVLNTPETLASLRTLAVAGAAVDLPALRSAKPDPVLLAVITARALSLFRADADLSPIAFLPLAAGDAPESVTGYHHGHALAAPVLTVRQQGTEQRLALFPADGARTITGVLGC
ncbi:hypothetical protein C5B92_16585 [Rathayibacter sp. AY1A4]|uniref:hypothetical protein n=3 Tax=unclassified Rathayibacter TaxID=2609250 RepID=UPI000CE801FE|nr:hypothetical protein [Rathayibacter sp. AY1A4]PPF12999.1 hypothetical protein C5B92_16585 [Rathayibacter sp. AY1A4]